MLFFTGSLVSLVAEIEASSSDAVDPSEVVCGISEVSRTQFSIHM